MQDAEALTPGLMIIHGNRLEALRELVVSWTRAYPLQPLENEVVLVQSNGIAQWLKLALAADPQAEGGGGCGIAAALDVQLPARFLWQTYRAVLGREAVPEQSPLDKQPLTWRLMRLLPELLDQPAFAPLQRFLADDADCRKRYQLAERLADLFDQYQVYRADWLNDWAQGRDRIGLARDGFRDLGTEECWQPALWRAVIADVGNERLSDSRAGIHPRFVDQLLGADSRPAGLPRRVIVFGISSLPAQTLEALAAIGRFSQVLLCVLNPCQYHWGDIVADQDLLRHQYRRQQRRPNSPLQLDDSTLHQHAHPLLAAWGKQGRDYINLLDSHDERGGYESRFAAINGGRVDLFEEPGGATLLQQLQQDVLELSPLAETRERWPAVTEQDRSIQFHLAHSPQREVEILHDQLLHAFDHDPQLKPRDIIVMVPDVNTYAPHIQAVFGQYASTDKRHIPFTLADQGQRGQEPLLIALEHLLALPDSRLPVSEVLDLLDVPAVRNRFGLSEQDLPTLRRWIEGAGVRWGLDQQRRSQLGMPEGLEANTWRFGLRRMLLGYAVGQGEAWQEIEPYDEIGGLDAALLGPLNALLDTLDRHEQALGAPAVPLLWGERLRALLEDFFIAESERDQYLLVQLQESLEQWLALCDGVDLQQTLPLNVVAEAWLQAVGQDQLSQRFLAGAVNVCTLMPMRAIPFKRICLLGMNDGDYPRAQQPLDFDLMGKDYRPGDRSRREDDRYLLLEAMLSARQTLYISWVGRSIRDNGERPPSVLVGQLRDHLQAGWQRAGGADLLAGLTTEHPLQPFNLDYFTGRDGLFSYAREWLPLHAETEVEADNQALPPAVLEAPIEVSALQRFLRNPVGHFFSQRLKVWLDEPEQIVEDDEHFSLNGLQRYQLSQTLLDSLKDAEPDADLLTLLQQGAQRLQQCGQMPLAGFAALASEQLLAPLADQLQRYHQQAQLWDQRLDHPLPIQAHGPAVELSSWLADVRCSAELEGLLRLSLLPGLVLGKKGLNWRKLLNDLVLHLCASASGHRLSSCIISADADIQLLPLAQSEAVAILHDWLEAWHQGLSRPLPVAPKTALAWLGAEDEDKALAQARLCYDGNDFSRGERQDSAALLRSFPDFASLSASGEFESFASLLYQPLVRAEAEQWLIISPAAEVQP